MKNLEDEYRKSQQEEMPDLWNRIEAGLPEKKSRKIVSISRYLGIAAAGIFLVLLVPGVLSLQRGGLSKSESAQNMAFDTTAGGMADSASEGNCADTAERQEALEEEMASAANSSASTTGFADSIPEEEMLESNSMAGVPQDALLEQAQGDCAAGTEENKLREESMEVVDITQADGYIVYTLHTENGEDIKAALLDTTETALQTGEKYLFTLQPVEGMDWEYKIEKVE